MSVINITITPLFENSVPGVPSSITLATNEPSTIFYTLDGTSPSVYSPVYVSPIQVISTTVNLTIKVYATNGSDTSVVITESYVGDPAAAASLDNVRVSHAQVFGLNNQDTTDLYPYGDHRPNPDVIYGSTAGTGTTVFNQSLPATSNGFNGNEQPAVFTNQPISTFDFKQVYSTSTYDGQITPGTVSYANQSPTIGLSTPVEYRQRYSSTADKLFNPRAMVIFNDQTTEDPTNPILIDRSLFTLSPLENTRDGELLNNTGLEVQSSTGSFINRFYNPRDQTLTNYFYDSSTNQWIVSKSVYAPTAKSPDNLSAMVFGRNKNVYQWVFGLYKTLY